MIKKGKPKDNKLSQPKVCGAIYALSKVPAKSSKIKQWSMVKIKRIINIRQFCLGFFSNFVSKANRLMPRQYGQNGQCYRLLVV